MSTLVAQTLSNGTVSTSTANCIQGSAKAWVSFNGVTPSIYSSYNVTSITKNAAGDYTINFTTSLGDGNYCTTLGVYNSSSIGSGTNFGVVMGPTTTPTATALRVGTGTPTTGTLSDGTFISAAIFR